MAHLSYLFVTQPSQEAQSGRYRFLHVLLALTVSREWRNGRRAGFRCQCPQGRGGSNPPSRTLLLQADRCLVGVQEQFVCRWIWENPLGSVPPRAVTTQPW